MRNGPFDGAALDISASIFVLCPQIEARNAKLCSKDTRHGRKARQARIGKGKARISWLCKLQQAINELSTRIEPSMWVTWGPLYQDLGGYSFRNLPSGLGKLYKIGLCNLNCTETTPLFTKYTNCEVPPKVNHQRQMVAWTRRPLNRNRDVSHIYYKTFNIFEWTWDLIYAMCW